MKDCVIVPVNVSLTELKVMDSMNPNNPEVKFMMGQEEAEAVFVLPSVSMLHLDSKDCLVGAVSVTVAREVNCPECLSAGGIYRTKSEVIPSGHFLAPGKYYIFVQAQEQPQGLQESTGDIQINIILEPVSEVFLRVAAANRSTVDA